VAVRVDRAALHRRFRVRLVHGPDTLVVATHPRPRLEDPEHCHAACTSRSRSEVEEVSAT
jgi:hypothetical protein